MRNRITRLDVVILMLVGASLALLLTADMSHDQRTGGAIIMSVVAIGLAVARLVTARPPRHAADEDTDR